MRVERSNCRFALQQSEGKPVIVLQLFQESIEMLKGTAVGFDLLGGTTTEDARKIVEALNDRVLNVFVTYSD
jgi:SpoU rRNA methylase family enzyme